MALDSRHLQREISDEQSQPAVTVRSVGLGLFLVVALDVLAICVRYVFHGSLMTYSHPNGDADGADDPDVWPRRRCQNDRGCGCSQKASGTRFWQWALWAPRLPCFGLTGYLIGYITAPYYFATEENAWAKHLYNRICPTGCCRAMKAMLSRGFTKACRAGGQNSVGVCGCCPCSGGRRLWRRRL